MNGSKKVPLFHMGDGGTKYIYCYSDGSPICMGDRLEVVESGNYAGGGSYHHHFTGTVSGVLSGCHILFTDVTWHRFYSCSQRFGQSEQPTDASAVVEYQYSKGWYEIDGKVTKKGQ